SLAILISSNRPDPAPPLFPYTTLFRSNDDNALFSDQPAIDNSGTLTFTTSPDANGQATVTVAAQDNGGTANGGQDTSPAQTFVNHVTADNYPPSFTMGGDQTLPEDEDA